MPSNLEVIDKKRFYSFEGFKVPSVTTILDLAYQKEWMKPWVAKKMAQEAAAGTSSTEEEFLGAMNRATKGSSEHGDDIHLRLERISKGESAHFEPLDEWNRRYSPRIVHSEVQVANITIGYAGTADIIAIIGGIWYLIDLKTGMNLDSSIKLQLAAYKNAEIIRIPGSGEIGTMPMVDKCAILWIPRKTPEEWSFREVSVGKREFQAFSACVDVANYHIATSDMSILGREVPLYGEEHS